MTGQPAAATARWRVAYAPTKGIEVRGAPTPLLGLPRFHVMLEHHAGWPAQELLELDEAHALRVISAADSGLSKAATGQPQKAF
jgi:hypothetical protein